MATKGTHHAPSLPLLLLLGCQDSSLEEQPSPLTVTPGHLALSEVSWGDSASLPVAVSNGVAGPARLAGTKTGPQVSAEDLAGLLEGGATRENDYGSCPE